MNKEFNNALHQHLCHWSEVKQDLNRLVSAASLFNQEKFALTLGGHIEEINSSIEKLAKVRTKDMFEIDGP